jgi:hypothetical protein
MYFNHWQSFGSGKSLIVIRLPLNDRVKIKSCLNISIQFSVNDICCVGVSVHIDYWLSR